MNALHSHLQRRTFLKGVMAVGALAASSRLLAQGTTSVKLPGDKVRLACVGIGNRGAEVIRDFERTGLMEIVALCDTEMEAKHTQGVIKKHPNAKRFRDFRQMFDKMEKQIDAVVVSTPDFSHFPATIQAMALGKPVYVEKPMAHSFRQIELLMAAAKKYRVQTQMGNQGHSEANYFQFKAWTEAGIIKNVTKITAFMNGGRRWHDSAKMAFSKLTDYLPEQPIPDSIDWETWLATAQDHKYNKGYLYGEWRSWYDFGNGALGDWGAHIFDTAHEFLDLGLPTEVDPVKIEGHNKFVFPQASTLAFRFPARGEKPPVELTWFDGKDNIPTLPVAGGPVDVDPNIPPPSGGSVTSNKAPPPGKVIYGDGVVFRGGSHASTLKIIGGDKAKEAEEKAKSVKVTKSPSNHFKNFLLSVQGRENCRSSFDVAGPLCQAMALGVIAQRLNTKLVFDPKTKRVTNVKAANDLLDGVPPRAGWEQFYKL